MDREKVIKGLEEVQHYINVENLPAHTLKAKLVIDDAIALLKAQEPVMVEERADTDTINCPKCGQQFARVGRDKSIYLDTDEEPNYCPKCGRAVKWE